jgi:hypothetical protein
VHAPARYPQLTQAVGSGDCPFERTATLAFASLRPLMARRSERRGQLPLEHHLDRFAHVLAQLGFQVLAKLQHRRMVRTDRATLLHGVPPSPFDHGDLLSQQGGYAIWLFLQESGRMLHDDGRKNYVVCVTL